MSLARALHRNRKVAGQFSRGASDVRTSASNMLKFCCAGNPRSSAGKTALVTKSAYTNEEFVLAELRMPISTGRFFKPYGQIHTVQYMQLL